MIYRRDLILDPIEEDLYNNASTPDDYNALGLNLGDCLEGTDWITLPDKDPNDPDSWINVNHCNTCDHDLPAAQDAAGFPMHHTGEAWEPCHPEDYGLAIVSSYSRYDPIHEDHVLDANNLLAPYHGEGERLTINGVDYRPFVIVTLNTPLSERFVLLTETGDGRIEGELHEDPTGGVPAEGWVAETYWGADPLERLEADQPHTADDWRKLADRLEQLLLPPKNMTPCDDGFIAGPDHGWYWLIVQDDSGLPYFHTAYRIEKKRLLIACQALMEHRHATGSADEFLLHNALTLFSRFGEPTDKPTK